MRHEFISATVLSLGIAAAIPSVAMADDDRRDRSDRDRTDRREVDRGDRDRIEHREIDRRDEGRRRDYSSEVDLDEVPRRVMDRVNDYRHGRRIEYAKSVHADGRDFYRFRIDDRDHGDFYLDIDYDGQVIRRVNL